MMSSGFLVRFARSCEFLLGALFLSAAVLKLANVPLFASQILSYGVISSPKLVAIVAEVLVPLEVILGVAMLAGLRLRGSVIYAALAMLVFFSALVAYAWPENCGCFGPIKLGPWETLTKNLVMGVMALTALFTLRGRSDSEPDFGAIGKWIAVIALGGLAAYFAHDELYNSAKYFAEPKKTGKEAPAPKAPAKPFREGEEAAPSPLPAPAPAQIAPPADGGVAASPVPAAPPASTATPASQSPSTATEDTEYPSAPTGSSDYPKDAPEDFKGFTVTGQDGKELDLGSGTYLVALLNATCDHCMHTVPAINELAVRPDVPTVVAIMQEPDPGSIDTFTLQTGASFPMLSLGNDFIKFSQFIKTAPPRFTLERDGRPIKSWEGYPPTAEELNAAAPK